MQKIKYLFKRITHMNFKQFFETINYIHKRTNKNRVCLFFDIIYCGFKYQAGYMDYKLFQMYNMNKQERSTIITRGINNAFIKRFNNKNYNYIFNNKLEFNKHFNKYLKRDWLELTDNNLEDFKKFVTKHSEIIVKPTNGQCGKGIEKLTVNKNNSEEIYNQLLNNKQILVEEVVKQCSEISKLHPYSINTLRVVTINKQVVTAYIRIGNNKNVVDNFNSKGVAAPINIETGIIDYPAIDKEDHVYEKHPLTKEAIVNFKIPNWQEVKEFVEDAATVVPEIGYIGWDVCVTENGPLLIEGNEFPGHDIYQLPPHRTNNQGLLPVFLKAINKEEK